ncbi:unnamed protein product [Paramecium sonneborni]|uniref:Uncharacterized protein n=1 Tax=Paramecium sonneborni TaxID=65129 RepID=A0A8S1RQJ8_9CILI|nr:unnamed protein product [Paramecium sonneborni]
MQNFLNLNIILISELEWMIGQDLIMVQKANLILMQVCEQKSNQFDQTAEMIKKSINKYHFDSDDKIFKDVLIDGSFSPHLRYPNLFPITFGIIEPTKLIFQMHTSI